MRNLIWMLFMFALLPGCGERVIHDAVAISNESAPSHHGQRKMKIFWNDQGRGPSSESSVTVDLEQALAIWMDEVRGAQGNFLGLVDENERTIQFYLEEGIPDHVDDAGPLEIVLLDFPVLEEGGSYGKRIRIMDVQELIRKAFEIGVDHRAVDELHFEKW